MCEQFGEQSDVDNVSKDYHISLVKCGMAERGRKMAIDVRISVRWTECSVNVRYAMGSMRTRGCCVQPLDLQGHKVFMGNESVIEYFTQPWLCKDALYKV